MQEYIPSLISAAVTIACVLFSNRQSERRTQQSMETELVVLRTELQTLRKEVERHNSYALRMPTLEEKIKVANHRIDDLEDFHKPLRGGAM